MYGDGIVVSFFCSSGCFTSEFTHLARNGFRLAVVTALPPALLSCSSSYNRTHSAACTFASAVPNSVNAVSDAMRMGVAAAAADAAAE
jgi:hypothetical protein